MTHPPRLTMLNSSCTLVALGLFVACASPGARAVTAVEPTTGKRVAITPAEQARLDGGIVPFTPADVAFMSGMIGHHGQAVLIASWARTHGANETLAGLCDRVVVSQRDEIHFMQNWLRRRKLEVPDGDMSHMMMPGMDHGPMMPGMLTPEELARLNAARGAEWDALFLQYMIKHHQGALTMVERLMAADGAARDEEVFKLAADIRADQEAEIDRMSRMLAAYRKSS